MKATKITTVLLVSAVALVLMGTTAYAQDKPVKPETAQPYRGGDGGRGEMQRPGMQQHVPQMGQPQPNLPMLAVSCNRHRRQV